MDVAATVDTNLVLDQYYLECLSHASYLIGDRSSGRAVVVDPRRDVSEYLADAEALGLSSRARLLRIELPLASRTILAGIKTAAVITVGFATLGALISAGGSDVFLANLDPVGATVWVQRAGDAQAQSVGDLALSPYGNVVVAGAFRGAMDFGGGGVIGQGGDDVFIASLGP